MSTSEVMEKTVAFFIKNEAKIKSLKDISINALKVLDEMIENTIDQRNYDFKSLMIVEVKNNKVVCKCKDNPDLLSPSDKKKILNWVKTKDHQKTYLQDTYRLDLSTHILLFKYYLSEEKIIVIGHMLKNNQEVKMDLLELQQNYLLGAFI